MALELDEEKVLTAKALFNLVRKSRKKHKAGRKSHVHFGNKANILTEWNKLMENVVIFPSLEGFHIKNRSFCGSQALGKDRFVVRELRNCELVQPFVSLAWSSRVVPVLLTWKDLRGQTHEARVQSAVCPGGRSLGELWLLVSRFSFLCSIQDNYGKFNSLGCRKSE